LDTNKKILLKGKIDYPKENRLLRIYPKFIKEDWMAERKDDRSTWAIGGGLLLGFGVGFVFLRVSVMAFIGSMIAGLGLGLLITSILSSRRKQEKNS
jgi:hypothetical protein